MRKEKEENKESSGNGEKKLTIEDVATFCKSEGFVFKSSEIYGGLAGFWDFGPLGVELFNNLKKEWWNFFVYKRDDMVAMEASIISNPKTWKASGHLANFNDVSVRCRKCKKFNKVDKAELGSAKCGFCGGEFDKASAKELNLMFSTKIGPVEEDSLTSYLRPETAQGMFMNFKLVQETSRKRIPFGIAQIGRCFRNEIAPRDFLFRSREFHIAEFEYFINPSEMKCPLLDAEHLKVKLRLLDAETQEKGKDNLREVTIEKMLKEKRLDEWHAYWLAEQIMFYNMIGINLDKIKVREHMKSELSHYSSATFDLDYEFPFGSKELAGNANRGQFDLTQHAKESNQKLDYFDDVKKERIVPRVIEPTFGMERMFLAALVDAYEFDRKRQNVVLHLNPKIAPFKAAVFPMLKDDKHLKMAEEIAKDLRKEWNIALDLTGSIGKRYARNDEIGTPMCITIDEQSPKDKMVTIRWRDNAEQVRVKIKDLHDIVRRVISGEDIFKLGKKINTRKKLN